MAIRRRLKQGPASASLAAFIAVYVLSYLKALAQADLVIDWVRTPPMPEP